jgi:hypothetical protein
MILAYLYVTNLSKTSPAGAKRFIYFSNSNQFSWAEINGGCNTDASTIKRNPSAQGDCNPLRKTFRNTYSSSSEFIISLILSPYYAVTF